MYRSILIASDGSDLAGKAVDAALDLAANLKAELIALNVQAPFAPPIAGEVPATFVHDPDEYDEMARTNSQSILDEIASRARGLNLECRQVTVFDQSIAQAIVTTANEQAADLIVMSSHGRSGFQSLILGSETRNVLNQCTIPVLVVR